MTGRGRCARGAAGRPGSGRRRLVLCSRSVCPRLPSCGGDVADGGDARAGAVRQGGRLSGASRALGGSVGDRGPGGASTRRAGGSGRRAPRDAATPQSRSVSPRRPCATACPVHPAAPRHSRGAELRRVRRHERISARQRRSATASVVSVSAKRSMFMADVLTSSPPATTRRPAQRSNASVIPARGIGATGRRCGLRWGRCRLSSRGLAARRGGRRVRGPVRGPPPDRGRWRSR